MKRRWKVLGPLVGCGIIIAILALSHGAGDGIEWMRKYGAKESISRQVFTNSSPRLVSVTYEFQFEGPIPEAAKIEAANFAKRLASKPYRLEDQQMISINPVNNRVYFTRAWAPNWLEVQWLAIKRRLGMIP